MGDKAVRCPLCGGADITPRTLITVYGKREPSIAFLIRGASAVSGRTRGRQCGQSGCKPGLRPSPAGV
jgi:hypothetical protein